MTRPCLLAAAALLAAAVSATATHAAGPQQRRLQIDAELVRDASFTGVEQGRARLRQNLSVQVVLTSDGTPMLNNPLDPDDTRRQMERAQRTQQKLQSALQRQGRAAAPAPGMQPVPSMQSVQAMQAQAQALMARCGQDRDCLMREASAISAARVGAGQPQVQARLQAYGDAVRGCERQHAAGAAREACIAEVRRQAGGGDDGEADEVAETPYLHFRGAAGACQWDAATRIDEQVEGSFGDVQGMVPYTETTRADGRDRDTLLCPLVEAVLDTRNGRLWTRVLPALRGAQGTHVRAEKGRQPWRTDGLQAPRWHESEPWLAERLARLDAEGSDRLQRQLPGGALDLKLRWKFAPL